MGLSFYVCVQCGQAGCDVTMLSCVSCHGMMHEDCVGRIIHIEDQTERVCEPCLVPSATDEELLKILLTRYKALRGASQELTVESLRQEVTSRRRCHYDIWKTEHGIQTSEDEASSSTESENDDPDYQEPPVKKTKPQHSTEV